MSYKHCQHVKENGIFCGSPSMKGRDYCYYHVRTLARRLAMAKARSERKPWRLDLPPLEDMYAVQAAITNVLEALAAATLDPKRGGLILYGLQQAANNVRLPAWGVSSHFAIQDYDERRVDHYPGLEAEFGLPKNVDLEAAPEDVFPPPPDLWEFPPRKPALDAEGLKVWKDVLAEQERALLAKSA
ncbi:MAG TPA: hypothetical protein VK976_15295 [Verrucomicrobiae bacterium]|jgi:hypothetical protein|nr:hypothetical protein [Verrucomicrobiae bacterium]